MAEAEENKVRGLRINLDFVKERGNLGVRRASVFMGLGLHAANRDDFRDYELNKLPVKDEQYGIPVDIVPPHAPKEIVDTFKVEFGRWITSCGLRELLEHYALAVDEVYTIGLVVEHVLEKRISAKEGNDLQTEFRKISGLPKKLRVLEDRFGISPKNRDLITSLYRVRNCLAHGDGIVTASFGNDKDSLVCKWRAFEIFTVDPKMGKELIGRQMYGVKFEKEGEILGRNVERTKTFKTGEQVRLTQQELWEICYFFAMECVPSLLDSTLAFCEKRGVRINRLPAPTEPDKAKHWEEQREREAEATAASEGASAEPQVPIAKPEFPPRWLALAAAAALAFLLGYVLG